MSTPVARVGDVVVGYCNGQGHTPNREFTGVWVTGSDTLTTSGVGVVRVGDTGVTDCGHTFQAATGSDVATDTGQPLHRVGDLVIVEGSGVGVTVTGDDVLTSG